MILTGPSERLFRIRDPLASTLMEITVVTAVTTIFTVRAFLAATGYPRVGHGHLHIAHMLWGGLLMIVAFTVVMQSADRVWKPFAAAVFGVGLGLFVDEVGKFVTNTNDYFFKPAFAVMYVLFVVLMLTSKLLDRLDHVGDEERLYFAAQAIAHQSMGLLSADERDRALDSLSQVGGHVAVRDALAEVLRTGAVDPDARTSRLVALWRWVVARYEELVSSRALQRTVVLVFAVRAFTSLEAMGAGVVFTDHRPDAFSTTELVSTGAGATSGLMALVGLWWMWRGRRTLAYRAFIGSTLVSILLEQVFAFARSEFAAIGTLTLDLLVLGALHVALASETTLQRHRTA